MNLFRKNAILQSNYLCHDLSNYFLCVRKESDTVSKTEVKNIPQSLAESEVQIYGEAGRPFDECNYCFHMLSNMYLKNLWLIGHV